VTAGARASEMGVLARLRQRISDRLGITAAESAVERTMEVTAEVHRAATETVRSIRAGRLRMGRKDWPRQYADRLRDRVEP